MPPRTRPFVRNPRYRTLESTIVPMVKYKTSSGMKSKHFAYSKKGMASAKKFAKETGGTMASDIRQEIKSRYRKKK